MGSTRPRSPTYGGIVCRCASSAHPRLEAECSSSETRQGSSIRFQETACTRRSSPPGSPPTRSWPDTLSSTSPRSPARSIDMQRRRGRQSARRPQSTSLPVGASCARRLRCGHRPAAWRARAPERGSAHRSPYSARAFPARRFVLARLSAAQPCAWSKVEASRASTPPTTPFFTSCTTMVTFLSARPPVGVVVTMYVSTR